MIKGTDINSFKLHSTRFFGAFGVLLLICSSLIAQNPYEKQPISKIDVIVAGVQRSSPTVEQYRATVSDVVGKTYSTPRIREAIAQLYTSKLIDTITVSADLDVASEITLTFNIKLKTVAQRISFEIAPSKGDEVTEEQLLYRLNLLTPGQPITEQTLRNNADEILSYLRDRGFYRSEVDFTRQPLTNANDVGVLFRVRPNDQATVSALSLNIEGLTKPIPPDTLKLKPGSVYSKDRLQADLAKVRVLLKKEEFIAPELNEPDVRYNSDTNTLGIALTGKVGPKVEVIVESVEGKLSSSTINTLLPIKREGTLDYAAIVEGERRIANYFQERGYFFASAETVCSVQPELTDTESNKLANETAFLCQFLGGEDLMGKAVTVKYDVNLDRKLRLTEIRVKGTDKVTAEDLKLVLRTKEANLLGIIPVLGYGRGYTSTAILEEDRATVKSIMAELGYQDADVSINRGVTPTGDDLIITFVIEEGPRAFIDAVTITGNTAVPTASLLAELPPLTGLYQSRARIRAGVKKLSEYYSNNGYYYARVTSKITDRTLDPVAGRRSVDVQFRVENEGKQVVINRVLITGNDKTKDAAIRKAVALQPGELLKSADVYISEQNLYGSDAFSRVDIKPQAAGDTPDGRRLNDVIVNVEEQPPRLMTYGGGASTDLGLSGFFDIRHVNLFGNLWQGGARIRVSQRQQLVQVDFVNPRFLRDGNKRFAPLTISALYQRDSTVTRFFRSTFDKGTFGIVQRVDEDGKPIDEFGAPAGSPTINRLAITAETNRTISRKNRTIFFLRYRFEDVRLFNIESLLIKDLLLPDAKTRISGVTATLVRDTRQNCSRKYSLLDLISKGEQTDPCRYNASDPTRGDYLTADYNVSVPALGANVGFQKFQATYNYFYTFPTIRGRSTTLAARGILGLSKVFAGGDRYDSSVYPGLNGLLPISERFFAGGSNNLRGFGYEEAGPRVAVVPTGIFRNSKGEPVTLEPFTVPFGGNALAVVNLEARVPLTESIRAVPFYDGGNVFRKARDIFKAPELVPGDVMSFNQRALWTHTIGLGLRIKTPVGGEFGVDYGRLLNPPSFLVPQPVGPNGVYVLRRDHIHFRFAQAF